MARGTETPRGDLSRSKLCSGGGSTPLYQMAALSSGQRRTRCREERVPRPALRETLNSFVPPKTGDCAFTPSTPLTPEVHTRTRRLGDAGPATPTGGSTSALSATHSAGDSIASGLSHRECGPSIAGGAPSKTGTTAFSQRATPSARHGGGSESGGSGSPTWRKNQSRLDWLISLYDYMTSQCLPYVRFLEYFIHASTSFERKASLCWSSKDNDSFGEVLTSGAS